MRRKSKSIVETMSRAGTGVPNNTRGTTTTTNNSSGPLKSLTFSREADNETTNVCRCNKKGMGNDFRSVNSTFMCGYSRSKKCSSQTNISKQKTIRMLIEGRKSQSYYKTWFSIKKNSIHSPLHHLHNWTLLFFYILFLSGPCVQASKYIYID